MKLNLGCGLDYKKGFINIDFNKNIKADYYFDLNKPLPFFDNTIDLILLKHSLEHLENPLFLIKECQRILKPNRKLIIITPYYNSFDAYSDFSHKFCPSERAFNEVSLIFSKTKIIFNLSRIGKIIGFFVRTKKVFHYIPNSVTNLKVELIK